MARTTLGNRMRITDMPAYKRIKMKFETGEFKYGKVSELLIYSYERGMKGDLTPGHYVDAINYGRIKFENIPEECRTRDFFVNVLSSVHKDVWAYVKEHIGEEFDREFFKDNIATHEYTLMFEENCFEYMPLQYIDEEMVSCAMIKAVGSRYCERRGDFGEWFYSVARRKPEVLTQDFWTLGARLFVAKRGGKNQLLCITPEKYKTEEYYFAMCLANDTRVMEDFPEEIITTAFLTNLINENVYNIRSFNEMALEKRVSPEVKDSLKFWQVAIFLYGHIVQYIPLNEERIAYFCNIYDEDSFEYEFGFKHAYKKWREQNKSDVTV